MGAADIGREAARQAYDLLYGVTTLAAEAPSIPGVDAFDWRELQRWRISEARLSAGSEVFFRPTGLWDRYKPAILGMLAFSILLVTFVVVLSILLRRSRAMEGQLVTAAARTEALQDKLLQSQKMKALGVLAGGVAHDFNNILAAIIGYVELSLDSVDKETDLREYLDNILAASLRGQNVTSQIMSFSRNRDTRLEPMQPHVVVQEVIDLVSETIPASIQIDVDVDDHVGWIHGNSGQVHQIVMNLCTNAYQSIEDSGRITVALSRAHYSAHDQKTQLGPGDYLVITVSDTGIGMDADALRQVYDPFYTTHKTSEATGLGLSIVYGIVSEHHGHIEMASERGSGTSVQVYFPAMDEPDKQDTGSKNLDGTEGDEHILWVDDEPMLVRLGKVALEKHGYSVTTAGSGDHALELFEQQPDFFSLIITDYAMPGMTGVALSKRIWKVRSKVPIILYTGFSDHVDQESAKRMGFSALLLKPLEMSGMIKTVRRVLDGSSQKLSA